MRSKKFFGLAAPLVLLACLLGFWFALAQYERATAAIPNDAAITAYAQSPVTAGKFVIGSGTTTNNYVKSGTNETTALLGVCELTQSTTGGLTRYAPPGTISYLTCSGGGIAPGDLLYCSTLAYGVRLSATTIYTRVGAISLENSTTTNNESLRVLVWSGLVRSNTSGN
ncbi:MAG: hypothetical protein ACE15C_14525 [Phycisphaerae bacterium]